MGNFYVNYTVRGPTQKAVASVLSGRSAKVACSRNDCVVVFDQQSDDQDQGVIAEIAARLSRELSCIVFAVLNHDDDILWYQLYTGGCLADSYDSAPGYFDSAAKPTSPAGGDARRLCAAFGTNDVATIEAILRKPALADDGYTFAFERHADLVWALGIPAFAVGTGYVSLDEGEFPEGLSEGDLLSTR